MSTYQPVVMNAALTTSPPPYYSSHENHPLVHFSGFPKDMQHRNANQPLVRSKSTGTTAVNTTSSPPSKLGTAAAAVAVAISERSPPSRRLSSGSACEVCRRRKTKCDGGQPCSYCASNRIECVHRPTRRKSPMNTFMVAQQNTSAVTSSRLAVNHFRHHPPLSSSPLSLLPSPYPVDRREIGECRGNAKLKKQTSCPTLAHVATHWPASTTPPRTSYGFLQEIPSVMDQLSCRTFSTVAHPLSLSSATNSNGSNGDRPATTKTHLSFLSMTPFPAPPITKQ